MWRESPPTEPPFLVHSPEDEFEMQRALRDNGQEDKMEERGGRRGWWGDMRGDLKGETSQDHSCRDISCKLPHSKTTSLSQLLQPTKNIPVIDCFSSCILVYYGLHVNMLLCKALWNVALLVLLLLKVVLLVILLVVLVVAVNWKSHTLNTHFRIERFESF